MYSIPYLAGAAMLAPLIGIIGIAWAFGFRKD